MIVINIILVILVILTFNELAIIWGARAAGIKNVVASDEDLYTLISNIENFRSSRWFSTNKIDHIFHDSKGSVSTVGNSLLFSHCYVGKGFVYRFTEESKIIAKQFKRVNKYKNN